MMKLFRHNPLIDFGLVECITISDEYKDKEIGLDAINRFRNVATVCFNDIGTEIETGVSSNYGNKKNVLAEIILNHYERNEDKVFRYHFTTNLSASEVGKHYTQRVQSRLREMCNIISLEGITDKRK
jgi:DNA replication protein DnaC